MRLISQIISSGLDAQHGCILVFLHGDVRALQNVLHLRLSDQRVYIHSTIGRKIKVTCLLVISVVKYG